MNDKHQQSEPEYRIQSSIYQWYNNTYCLAHHSPRHIIFSVPNGGTRNPIEAVKMKSTGLLPGVSDLIIVQPGRTLFVEVKTDVGRLSPVQYEFKARVTALGHVYVVVRSLDEFKIFINGINGLECISKINPSDTKGLQ